MINPQKAVQWYKDKYGETPLSDYEIYEKLKDKFKDSDFGENPYDRKEKPSLEYEEQDPSMWEKILTYNMADNYAADNEWMAQAYNKSTAGIIHEIMHGKPKYDVGQAEGWLNEAGQFFVGLASPIDMISFFGSGMVGGAVAKKIGSNTLKKWALSGSKDMMKKKGLGKAAGISKEFHQYLGREAALESGFSLAALGATHGALAESAKQSGEIERGERDNFNPWAITGHAMKHGATNLALGSVAGFYTKGKMAPKFAKAKMATEKDFQNKLTRLTMNPLGQVAAEAAVFTTGQLGEQAIAGQPVKFDDFLSGFFMNSAIVGGMRTMTKPLRLGQNDATRYEKAKKEFYKDFRTDAFGKKVKNINAETIEKLKDTAKSLEEAGVKVPKEIGEKIAELELAKERDLGAASQFNTLMKDYGKILNELNEKGASSLSKESQVKLMTELGTIQTVLNKIYRDFKADKELAYEAYKDYFGGKKLTDKQKDLIDTLIDTKIETTQRGHDMLNGLINGDKDAIKNMRELYSEGFETSVSKNKETGKWELSLETPEGNLAELPNYYKAFKTEAAAKKASKSIKEGIKRLVSEKETKETVKESIVKDEVIEYYDFSPTEKAKKLGLTIDDIRSQVKDQKNQRKMYKEGLIEKKSATASDVNVLTSEGRGIALSKYRETRKVNLTDKNQSFDETAKEILKEAVEEVVSPILPTSEKMPISKPAFEKKQKTSQRILTDDAFVDTSKWKWEEREFRKIARNKGLGKRVVRDSLEEMSSIDRVAFVDWAVKFASENKGLNKKNKLVVKDGAKQQINEVAKFLVEVNKKNKDVSEIGIKDIGEFFDNFRKQSPNTIRGSAIVSFSEFILGNKFVDQTIGLDLVKYSRSEFAKYNEYVAKGKNPAKEGVRKNTIEEAIKTGDEGVELVAKLGARYYIRNQEINKLANIAKDLPSLEKYLKFDKKTNEFYLEMPKDIIAKAKTFDRYVWLDANTANQLKAFIVNGGSLEGKVTKVGQLIKNKVGTDNEKSPFYDLRRRGKVSGKLEYSDVSTQDYMFGHNRNRIDAIYKTLSVSEHIKLQKQLHNKLGSPMPKETFREFYKIGETKIKGDTAKEVHYARRKRLGEKYSEVVIELVKEFKDKSIPKDAVGYLEKAENWAIKVKMGKAPSDTIPHEISHYVFKVMDAVGRAYKNQKLPKDVAKTMKLIKEAKKLFVNKKGKFVEEDAVIMIGKAIDGQLQKPMMAKAKSFFKRFNVWLKGLFNKPMTKEELSFILGERVLERKGIPNPKELGLDLTQGREYMQTMELDIGKFKNVVNRDVRIASKEMGIKRTDLINFVAQEAGIPNHNKFRLSLPKDQTADIFFEKTQQLRDFYTTFKSFNLDKFVQKENALKKLRIIRKIESLDVKETESRIAKGITKEAQKSILKNSFGVKDGNLWNASYDQLKRYNDYMYQLKTLDRNHVDWVLKSEINEFANLDVAKGAVKTWQEVLMLFGETGDAIGSVGLKTLQSKLKHHYSVQQGNEGALMTYEANVKSIIGGLRANAKMNKINDRLWTLDNRGEMLLEQLKWMDKKISKADKKHAKESEKFFRKAIKDNWWDTVKLNKSTGREIGDALNAKNKQGEFKYLNLDTVEGKIANEYFKLSDAYGEKKLKMSLLDKSSHEAEYQGMLENTEVDFLSTHIARNFTDHGKHVLRLEGKAQRDSVNKMAEEIAYNEAVRRFGKETVDKDLGIIKRGEDSPYEYGLGLAAMKFHDMMQFNPAKLSIKHLKKRFSMQELYLEDGNGKLHRTYEWKFDRTVKPYVWGMSKFYATLEVFPEMAKFEGFNKPGVKEQLAKLSIGDGRGRKIGRWVEDAVLRQLGLDTSSNPYDITFRSMETAARTLAKTGLSFPTSGVKNIFTGQTQSLYALKAHDWFRGMVEVFTADSKKYNEAVATNAFGVGNKIYEAKNSGQMSKIANTLSDWAFSFGGMRVTERFNRLSTIFAAKHDINRQINALRSYKPGDKQYKKAEKRLKWYEVTPEEVKLLAKFGSSEGTRHLKGFEKLQTMRRLDNIHQKMNTYAHVKTQGSSSDLFMPKWAGTRGAKPLTLFKRMAFAATSNTAKNLKQARDERNIIKPIMGLTATYLSGQAMLGIYRTVLGTHMPKENSDWWERFNTVMWKGELFGILSDWASPFDNSDTLNPAIWNSLGSVFVAVDQLVDGKVTKSQAFDQIVKKNLSAYNNYIKIKERTNNPLNKDRLRFGKLYRDFEEEVFETPNITLENTTRTKYFKDLAAVFYDNKTTDKEWAEQLALTYVGLAHDYFRTNRADSKAGAFKLAKKTLKQKLTGLNPNKATLFKKRRAGKVTSLKFYKWLSKHSESETLIPRLLEIEKEYKIRLGKFQKSVPGIWRKMNIEKMIDDFNWTQIEY